MVLFADRRGRGWFVTDDAGRDVLGVVFINKRAAVAAIRAFDFSLPASTQRDLPPRPASLD